MNLQVIKTQPLAFPAEDALRKNVRIGMILILVLVGGLGGLAATLPMAGAVIAGGEVTVESHVKQIGHPAGGVIADVLVRDGDHVRAGQVLMRLDSTVSAASAMMSGENVDQLMAREARLIAERDGYGAIVFPPSLMARASNPAVAAILDEERRSFALRGGSRGSQAAELGQRIRQTQEEIAGYEAQARTFDQQASLIDEELSAATELWEKRYITLARLNQLKRSAVSLRGDAANARTAAAQARSRISEIQQQTMSLGSTARSDAGTELTTVQAQLSELRRNKIAADDTNARNVIRAPQAGVVDKLAFKTIGGVVPPGETIMEIIPDGDQLVVSAKIRTADIDQVREGQTSVLRFSAFSMRTTPEIEGQVERVSADRRVEEQTGAAYYTARVRIPPDQLALLRGLKLKPGMPVEVFIQTGQRTMLSYLVKPLSDQFERAFREN